MYDPTTGQYSSAAYKLFGIDMPAAKCAVCQRTYTCFNDVEVAIRLCPLHREKQLELPLENA